MSRNLLLSGLYAVVPIGCELPRVTFSCENGLDDSLPSLAANIG